jgi:hypothetical protein
MTTIFTDLIKLAMITGKIGKEIPAHYVEYALALHKQSRKHKMHRLPYQPSKTMIIRL